MADVSVIIPVYNVEKYLKKCVDSVTCQTHTDIEIILVDDGSRDRSGDICDELAKTDARIRVIHKENAGVGYARNSGLDVAVGKYIYFADPDDYLEPDLIADNLKVAEETGADITVFGSIHENYNKDGEVVFGQERLPKMRGYYDYDGFKENFDKYYTDISSLWIRLYRRDFIESHHYRFTNQRTGQDAIFNLGIYKNPFTVAFNPKAYYHYIIRNNSATTTYRDDRIQCEANIVRALKDLIDSFGFADERYAGLFVNFCMISLSMLIKNMSFASCPLSFSEKRSRIKGLLKNPDYAYALKRVALSSFGRKAERLKVLLLKLRLISPVVLLSGIKTRSQKLGK